MSDCTFEHWLPQHLAEQETRASDPRQRELVARVVEDRESLQLSPELEAFARKLMLVHDKRRELDDQIAYWNRQPIFSASDAAVVEDRTFEPKERLASIDRSMDRLEELGDSAARAFLDELVLELGLGEGLGAEPDAQLAAKQPAVETSIAPSGEPEAKTQAQRQKDRYDLCIAAGLSMPGNDYARLPRGIGKVAKRLGITRQSLAEDIKAHIRRSNNETAGER